MNKKKMGKTKRVCIVRHSYYPDIPPTRRDAETLAANGYEVDVICLRNKGEKHLEVIKGVTVHRIPIRHRRRGILSYLLEYATSFLLISWKLSILHIRKRYQAIEVNAMPDILVFAALLPKLLGAKVVLNVLDNTPEVFAEHFALSKDNVIVRLLCLVEKVSGRWADQVIATQTICRELLVSRGVPNSKISIVLNVPDDDYFSGRPSNNHNGNKFCIITHGSLLERYGVQTLIRAVPLMKAAIPNLEVQIVGDGEYRFQLEELAQSLAITDHVNFIGRVPYKEVLDYIARADLGIVTILTTRNPMLPNKLFDYLASCKPTISAAIPAIEAYFNGKSVMFYEPDDEHDLARCVLELHQNPERRRLLARAGLAKYQEYRWAGEKSKYLNVFERLIESEEPPQTTEGTE